MQNPFQRKHGKKKLMKLKKKKDFLGAKCICEKLKEKKKWRYQSPAERRAD